VQDKGQWRRCNFELYKLYDEQDLAKHKQIKVGWASYMNG
jgi:hypothetical protein